MAMRVAPSELTEVICVMPKICPNWRSSGVATEVATVFGSAPGNVARTLMVGKSISGSGATGSSLNASAPNSAMPIASSVVATGRWMNGSERFIAGYSAGAGLRLLKWFSSTRCIARYMTGVENSVSN